MCVCPLCRPSISIVCLELTNLFPLLAGEFHAVNQIVAKGLHTSDDATLAYTTTLIGRLETTKAERADDDAIHDDTAGQAVVEQFAQETFARAERTMTADKVTRQTADTFDAAATFFDLTHEWGDPGPEVLQKIKFAKWNAARILKAIREGTDPNESNPKPQLEDELDAETAALAAQQQTAVGSANQPQPAAVEEIPDVGEPSAQSATTAAHEGYFPPAPVPPPASAAQPAAPAMTPAEAQFSPTVPSPSALLPTASPQLPTNLSHINPLAPAAPPPPPVRLPQDLAPSWSTAPPPSAPPPVSLNPAPVPSPMYAATPSAPAVAPAPVAQNAMPAHSTGQKDMNEAQKHAKWAISALNFEDVPTAIMELRNALAALGAQ